MMLASFLSYCILTALGYSLIRDWWLTPHVIRVVVVMQYAKELRIEIENRIGSQHGCQSGL